VDGCDAPARVSRCRSVVRPFAVIAVARRRAAPFVGPARLAALLMAASLSVGELPVPISSAVEAPGPAAPAGGLPADGGTSPGATSSRPGDSGSSIGGGAVMRDPHRPADVSISCTSGPRGVVPADVAHHGPTGQKVVALTFDDGWGGATLTHILLMLRNAHVNATFFPIGRAILHDPRRWRAVVAAGFPIGDHTFDHGTLEGQCYAAQVRELRRERETAETVLGVAMLPVMRPPGGQYDDLTRVAARAAGEQAVVLWDVDTRDWTGIGASAIAANALAGGNGSIVVLHTMTPNTARALPRIIAGYRKRGFTFVTIGQLLGIPGPVPFD
jgi:peptidoglycan/xylan/chitin deacetylase (PgdA/CDA1 family)